MAKIKIKYKKGGPSQIPALRAALSLFCSIFWIRTSISDGSICGILSDSAIFFRASRLLRGTNARPILYHSRAFMSLSIVKHFCRRDTLVLALAVTFVAAMAGSSKPKEYVCYRAAGKIVIDGKLDEPSWRDAPATDEFVDIEGDIRPHPRFTTRAKMLWDDQYFYIGADLEEPHVWATLTKRDSVIFHDNDFEVFIDPNGDRDEYYELEINALNTAWDLFLPKPYIDGGKAQNSWDIAGLKTAVEVTGTLNDTTDLDKGWSV